tara:strand:- start:478 stop:846 length:369 start_codon:yes stop_codon:yes gene_type:complete
MDYKIDYEGLGEFLNTLTYRGIKNGDLVKAHSRNDIDYFYKTDEDKSSITLDQIIEYGQPFLVDAIGNDMSVCILTKRKYKLPTGRVVGLKLDCTLIYDCRTVLGDCLNGYYVIPDRFIKRK